MDDSAVHICTFSVGIDELPRSKQRDAGEVIKILGKSKRFSVFEATANNVIAKTMDRMQGHYFKVVGGAYPWCEIEITEAGEKLLAEGREKLYRVGDTVEVQQLIYPGPREFKTEGRVIRCMSPTYYEVEYVDHKGDTRTQHLKRSQLP